MDVKKETGGHYSAEHPRSATPERKPIPGRGAPASRGRGGSGALAPQVLLPHPDSVGDDGDVGQFSPMDDGLPEAAKETGVSAATPAGNTTPDPAAATSPSASTVSASPGEAERIAEQRRVAEMRRKAAAARTKAEDAFEIDTQSDVANLFAPPMKKERREESVSDFET